MIKSVFYWRLLSLILCSVLSVCLILFLYKIADAPNIIRNGFSRKIDKNLELMAGHFKNLNSSTYYFAGSDQFNIYVGDLQKSSRILQFDTDLLNVHELNLSVPFSNSLLINSVDSNFIFSSSGQDSTVFEYELKNKHLSVIRATHIPQRFTISIPVHAGSLIFRTIDTSFKENTISKFNNFSKEFITNRILEKQENGFFSTDGILKYDRYTDQIVYVYFYRNQFIVMDTNIQLRFRENTIDTNTRTKLNIKKSSGSQLITFASPPVIINQHVAVYQGYLYINSGLLADNENRQSFSKSSIIDIYSLENGHYQHSFYIPPFDGYKIRDFIVMENALIALQGPFIVRYLCPVKFIQ